MTKLEKEIKDISTNPDYVALMNELINSDYFKAGHTFLFYYGYYQDDCLANELPKIAVTFFKKHKLFTDQKQYNIKLVNSLLLMLSIATMMWELITKNKLMCNGSTVELHTDTQPNSPIRALSQNDSNINVQFWVNVKNKKAENIEVLLCITIDDLSIIVNDDTYLKKFNFTAYTFPGYSRKSITLDISKITIPTIEKLLESVVQ